MDAHIKKVYVPMTETGFYILLCLKEENHGYGIVQRVKEMTGGDIVLAPGTMYGSLSKMEKDGVMIPVLSAECTYKNAVRFDETVLIYLKITQFNGFKMTIEYIVKGKENGDIKAIGKTRHFFVDSEFKPIRVKDKYPEVYNVFNDNKEEE